MLRGVGEVGRGGGEGEGEVMGLVSRDCELL